MHRRTALLAMAGTAWASGRPFSVMEDLLAYPQYEIIFSDSYISEEEASSKSSTPASSQEMATASETPSISYERLTMESLPYLCSIPRVEPASAGRLASNSSRAAEEETAELARVADRGSDLLQPMANNCLYFVSGWWSYQFCYAQSVKQFHSLPPSPDVPMWPPTEDPTTPTYVLGRVGEKVVNRHRLSEASAGAAIDSGLSPESWDGSTTTTVQAKGTHRSRYLSQKLDAGTLCDLTGTPRHVEVQFHCHPQSADRIAYVKEISTCAYRMVVYTPRLCDDLAFLPEPEDRPEEIVCVEVVEDVTSWQQRQKQKQTLSSDSRGSTRPMVGGIEVGAEKIVKSAIQPPLSNPEPQEMYRDRDGNVVAKGQTLAHQHPAAEGGAVHRMSDRELRELGVDLRKVEKATKQLQERADGRGWQLQLFVEDGEAHLRGVVVDENEASETVPQEEPDVLPFAEETAAPAQRVYYLDENGQVYYENRPGHYDANEEGGHEEYHDDL